MQRSWSGVLLLPFLIAVACGGERDFNKPSPADGGGSGVSGNSSTAGRAGAGSSGRGGSAGSSAGGSGRGGSAGADAGNAGSSAEAGDSGLGGSNAGGEGGTDAQDGGAGGTPPDPSEPCDAEDDGAIKCAGSAERGRLRCNGETWEEYDGCGASERCDTRPESDAACEPVVSECADKNPGEGVCVGQERFDCGPDLVTVENTETCEIVCVERETESECSACDDGQFSTDGRPESCTDWASCGVGQYVSQGGTGRTDRECADCESGSYSTTENAESCEAWTDCAAGTYETAAGTATSDRQCTACAAGTYSSSENAESCSAWTNCAAGTYEADEGTASSDRECESCASGSYSTTQNATSCADWTTCATGTYVSTAGSATANRACSACAAGSYSSSQNAASCSTWATCAAGSFVSTAGSATTNRACSACASGSYSTTQNAASCGDWTTCAAGTFVSTAGTATANRACSACASGSYSSSTNAGSCSTWATCAAGSFVSTAGTATVNRACSTCASGSYSTTQNAGSCGAWTTCAAGTFVSTAGTTTSNRACSACASGNYSSGQNSTSCSPWTTCTWPMGGQVQAGTASANAVCGTPSAYRQFGSASYEFVGGVATDGAGNVFVVGYTGGEVEGANPAGDAAFIRKYDGNGTKVWTRQFSASATEGSRAFAVAADGSGNSYVAGFTAGVLDGTSAGAVDAFVRKYDAGGTATWTRQFGTSTSDYGRGITVDTSGNVYVVGQTGGVLGAASAGGNDAYVRKYSSIGNPLWTIQWGTASSDNANAVKTNPGGDVYVVGEAGSDAELRTFTTGGGIGLVRPIASTGGEDARGLAVTGNGDAYVTGYTSGALVGSNAGSSNVYIRKYLANGDISWTRQFGTTGSDYGTSLGADGSGNVYVAGYTAGTIAGTSAGENDAFLRKYGPTGSILWTEQFGTSSNDDVGGMAVDGNENLYVAGSSVGNFAGTGAGGWDAWVGQIVP